ncbi:XRE family transcriptional regulator [Streptomyces sp. NPDC001552]|uniref:XRE family transcriptional regulator n=1 Tax=Streptomyces sp. NPDC001552 TaxID=3364587 RepID=UPI0036A01535
MANERLRASISANAATIQSVALQVGVDPKTVERWITTDRTPHRTHRWKTATFLGVDEVYLWPSIARQAETASASELVTYYPHRGVVPVDLWSSLIDNAVSHVEVLVYAGLFLFDGHPELAERLSRKARAGAQVRILLGNPTSEVLRQRGEEEGIGADLAARARMTRRYLEPAMTTPGGGGPAARDHPLQLSVPLRRRRTRQPSRAGSARRTEPGPALSLHPGWPELQALHEELRLRLGAWHFGLG